MKNRTAFVRTLLAMALMPLAIAVAGAQEAKTEAAGAQQAAPAGATKGGSAAATGEQGHGESPLLRYEGAGSSPLAAEPMHQDVNPRAPKMTEAEFEAGKQIYFERCAGCHG
ncbi:MAG: hypothetical protein KGJ99_11950, partial [Betaproteobacteria bacterium]|nr:hypothetical protein [Betaproteobacteria bacterium]